MRYLAIAGLLGMMAVVTTGCVCPAGAPVYGGIYSDVVGPVAVGDTSAGTSKCGTAEAEGIICFATGDASIAAAAKAGGITKIHHVDVQCMNILGFYSKVTTKVYGE